MMNKALSRDLKNSDLIFNLFYFRLSGNLELI